MSAKNEELDNLLAAGLRASGKTVGTAESCTGGGVAYRITSVPGSSEYFSGGVIAYANDVKEHLLKIESDVLEQVGAVSEEVAANLAENARRLLDCDYAVSTTGIAGPGGGSASKPVGLVFIGAASEGHTVVRRFLFEGDRAAVREQAINEALLLLLSLLD